MSAISSKSNFNAKVYALVSRIPPGKVLSYSRVAHLLGVSQGARAVGWALRYVPHDSPIPWQRVINVKGYISTSHLDQTAEIQRARLEAEGVVFSADGQVDMKRFQWAISFWEVEAETFIEPPERPAP